MGEIPRNLRCRIAADETLATAYMRMALPVEMHPLLNLNFKQLGGSGAWNCDLSAVARGQIAPERRDLMIGALAKGAQLAFMSDQMAKLYRIHELLKR